MIRVILTPCSLVVALGYAGELQLVTVICSGRPSSATWWYRDRKITAAVVGCA